MYTIIQMFGVGTIFLIFILNKSLMCTKAEFDQKYTYNKNTEILLKYKITVLYLNIFEHLLIFFLLQKLF